MRLPTVSDFCGCFSLQTGTIVISVAEFVGSMFCMFLLLLCNGHAQEMAAKLEADIIEDAEREGIMTDGAADSEHDSVLNPTVTINVVRFNDARYLVELITLSLWLGLVFYLACCIASLLLFIGAALVRALCLFQNFRCSSGISSIPTAQLLKTKSSFEKLPLPTKQRQNRAFIFSWLSVSGLCILVFHSVIITVILTSRSQLRLLMAFFVFIVFCPLSYCFIVVRSYFIFLKSVQGSRISTAKAITFNVNSSEEMFHV